MGPNYGEMVFRWSPFRIISDNFEPGERLQAPSLFSIFGMQEYIHICYIFFTGELDPERMGSGIQYGDSSLRRLQQREQQRQKKGICDC